ncbi:hypothetical protein [Acidithiobacillus ferriphilus]|uniref:hypothetical protein n=1 Tax=Acidithiobacillus ferriphilus TaxID=1689834 RepID=UPI002DBFE420|nr:hypothetical protein [Acidithiobacillus ferriphilus]MEB8536825.1 hypothetical protein [Acidithiobacillus ferriphilus]
MDSLTQFAGSAAGQIVAGIVALSLFFWMADDMISGQEHQQMQKNGYQMCMQNSRNAEYCSMVFSK